MREKCNTQRWTWALALVAILAMGLVSCSQPAQPSSTASASSASASSASSAETQKTAALYGSPWVTSVFAGNLPEKAPEAADDLYLHYAYDYAAAHQEAMSASAADDAKGELQTAVTAAIKNTALASPELEQLRIFYNQAADMDALKAAGASELTPYLKAIADTKSLAELEAVLLSDSFPFSPWIETTVSAVNMKSTMCVAVMPNMLFSDAESGTDLYQDGDEKAQAARSLIKAQKLIPVESNLMMVSLAEDSKQAEAIANQLFDLEKRYGKDTDQNKYLNAEYGAQTQAVKAFTFDELEAACPNFPLRKTLAKLGEDAGENVIVMYPEWLASFNDVWTEENFELLRTMTEVKVLNECSAFLNPAFYADMRAYMKQADPTADEFAYAACDKTGTFSQLLAKIYAEHVLGEQVASSFDKLANDLIDSYIELVGNTAWLDAQSRENIIDKIDNIALNILSPDGGYFDYSGLNLTPTEEGGTLFGNYLALKAYNDKLEAELVGQPARASATWLYLKPTMQNCFYDAVSNSINIFPGYITSATYNKDMSAEELLAGVGFAVGHEISHAFDYSGSQFNAYGEPIAVFANDDVQEFVAKRQRIADYYSTFEVATGVAVDGTAVSAEATADLCGMQVILERARNIEGFNYEKLFGSLASSWATVSSPAYMDLLLLDAHALNNVRVNASAQMFDEFYDAYHAAAGNAMYLAPESRLAMWGKNSG